MNCSVCAICALALVAFANGYVPDEDDSISLMSVYYNPKSHRPFRLTSIENILVGNQPNVAGLNELKTNLASSLNTSSIQETSMIKRLGFRSNGCTCQQLTCGCCLGINLNQFNFNREGCMNFTYDPYQFSVNMDVIMDENPVFSNSFSAKNPPPLCLPVPIPYIPIQIEACARLFDIHTPGQNLQMCLDFETRIESAAVLVLHFDCMKMGTEGVNLVKPGDTVEVTVPTTAGTTTPVQVNSDVYDPVTEIKYQRKN